MIRPVRIMVSTFLMAASVLAAEVVLTRVFSVLMWYHFAFLAISVCLFGLGAGSLALHLFGGGLREDRLPVQLGSCAIGFALAQGACVAVLRVLKLGGMDMSAAFLAQMTLVFLICALPFGFAGFFLGLVFSRGAERIGRLYFADLAGASAGCLATIYLLTAFGGEAALLAAGGLALLAGLAAAPFSYVKRNFALQSGLLVVVIALIAANQYTGFLDFHHTKGNEEPDPIAVEWNSFSRVIAYPRKDVGDVMMVIDGIAHTPITPFTGDAAATQTPQANLQRLPYEFLSSPSVLIIGSGGGEHILTGLATGARKIVGVEMNPIVIDMVEKRFAYIAGGLFRRPGVTVELAEGRSYVSRSKEKFDLINFTLVDTWAATAGGAFALTENYLFTTTAFREYIDHLTPQGLLAVKRWRDAPEYAYRLAALGRRVLERRGRTDAENCVYVAADKEFVNVMIRRSPFSLEDIHRLHELTEKLGLELVYSPYTNQGDKTFQDLLRTPNLDDWLRGQRLDYSPPTDNRPFFFHTLRLPDLPQAFKMAWSSRIRNIGVLILFSVLVIVAFFTALMILGPLLILRRHRMLLRGNLRAASYFALLGIGYLTIEISLMQSFILYLGHPTLTLSVFLSTLLVASAVGSGASSFVGRKRPRRALVIITIALIGAALAIRSASPQLFAATLGLPTTARCLITAALLFPLGFLMGMPFPLGVRAVREDGTVPWMFAINSAASVLGSVAAVVIAIAAGFGATAMVGLTAYLLALFANPAEAE